MGLLEMELILEEKHVRLRLLLDAETTHNLPIAQFITYTASALSKSKARAAVVTH